MVETLLWEEGRGYVLLDRHLQRLEASAAKLGFASDVEALRRQLQAADPRGAGRCKVRLLLAIDGTATITAEPLPPQGYVPAAGQVEFASEPIDSAEPLLYHKTTWRPWYDGLLERHPGCLDVLFHNERGEVTEGTVYNLVVEKAGRLVTPPLTSGLLPGTLRQELLVRGLLVEEVVTRRELLAARRFWLINSIRGWRRVTLVS